MTEERAVILEETGSFYQPAEVEYASIHTPERHYSKVLQGKPIHSLLSASTSRGNIQLNNITHEGVMESEGVMMVMDEEVIGAVNAQTFKVLIILLTAATEQLPRDNAITAETINRGRKIRLPLTKYMEACKIKDVKEARDQLNNAINALYGISFNWTETVYEKPEGKSRKVKTKKTYRARLLGRIAVPTEMNGKPVKRGVAEVNIDYDMAEYLAGAYIMPYPDELLQINTRYHPYSVPLGWKLCALHNMNFGKDNANITTVKTLLSAAKGIPRYADIAKQGHIYERLIARLDRDLAALVEAGVLSSYWYYDDSGERIDGGLYKDGKYIESGGLALLSYTEFSSLYVHYELKDYPDQTPRLEEKSRRIRAAIARNASKHKAEEQQNMTEDIGSGAP